jgi:cytidyltransferase-like protein
MTLVQVSLPFDNPGTRDIRFLQEAARLGELQALLWSDQAVQRATGAAPRFPLAERLYFLESVRFVRRATVVELPLAPGVPAEASAPVPDVWVVDERTDHPDHAALCRKRSIGYHVVREAELAGFPAANPGPPAPGRPKVLVTGSFDWFHSGHVRFFEEVSALGELYVVVGHDRNIRLLKGDGHPLYPEQQRRYLCGAIRFVRQALVSTGDGWLDAEPEIRQLRPDIYAVNEDGDKPEKREFCAAHGIRYEVLKRTPKDGLAPRSSTGLKAALPQEPASGPGEQR